MFKEEKITKISSETNISDFKKHISSKTKITVYNADGVIASIQNSTDDVDVNGYVTAVVTLNANAPRNIGVVVNVYDLASGCRIDYGTVYIVKGGKSAEKKFKVDGSKYKICMFKINSASCQ